MSDEQDTEQVEQTDQTEHPEHEQGGQEAKKYRLRLRETEAERDDLQERLQALQRATVEDVATREGRLPSTAALWASTELSELLDEGGNLDHGKVLAACEKAAEDFNVERVPDRGPDPSQGQGGDFRGVQFSDAFRPQ